MKRLSRLSLEALLLWGFGTLVVGTVIAATLAFAVWHFTASSFEEYETRHAPVAAHASNGVDAWMAVRRHEENFIVAVENSHDPAAARARYLSEWESGVQRLRTYLSQIESLSESRDPQIVALRAELESSLASYVSRYTAVVEGMVDQAAGAAVPGRGEDELRRLRSGFMDAAYQVEAGLERLELKTLENTHQSLLGVERRITDMALFSAVLALLTVVVGATVAMFVGGRIREATRRIIGFAARVAAGRFEVRLDRQDSGQFGRLESALNTMADRLQQSDELMNEQARQLEASNRRIALLSEMTGLLQAAVSMEEATRIAAQHLSRMNLGAGGGLYLHDDSGRVLQAIERWGETLPHGDFPAGDCWAMRLGQPYAAEAGAAAPPCAHATSLPAGGESLCLPLTAPEGVSGLIHILFSAGSGQCREEDQRFAMRLVEQLGLALANLRLRITLRNQSMNDPLTGLHNRRFLDDSLVRECARALRDQKPLAVLMIDADHFKLFNDLHGHQAGDQALRQIGAVLAQTCRAGDLACRFGGEEFTVVLPGTAKQGALAWAQRLLDTMRRTSILVQGRELPPVTVSVGIAVFPEHGATAEAVLRAADLALYEAKHRGRDGVVAA